MFHGKTHYFDWAMFNSKLFVITRPGKPPLSSGIFQPCVLPVHHTPGPLFNDVPKENKNTIISEEAIIPNPTSEYLGIIPNLAIWNSEVLKNSCEKIPNTLSILSIKLYQQTSPKTSHSGDDSTESFAFAEPCNMRSWSSHLFANSSEPRSASLLVDVNWGTSRPLSHAVACCRRGFT